MTSNLQRFGDVDINQDLDFQRRSWKVQRVGWIIMALLILSGLAGLFGHGPVSDTTVGDAAIPLVLEYERFGRFQSPTTMRVQIKRGGAPDGNLSLWVSHAYLRRVRVQRIQPEPEHTDISHAGMTFRFCLARPDDTGEIILHIEAQAIGRLSGRIGLGESRAMAFTQWIYP